jgi:hypothetical protein
MTKGVAATKGGSSSEIIVGAVTLPVVLLIYLFVNRLRHKVLKESDEENAHMEKHG